MNDYIEHHGIRGMKWGIRRTPEQLGHKSGEGSAGGSGGSNGSGSSGGKASGGSSGGKKRSSMTDEELRGRINRLKMEEEYSSLLKRQKENSRGTVRKLLGQAAENLGRQSLDKVVTKMVNKAFGEKKRENSFDMKKYKDKNYTDLVDVDLETMSKISQWWDNAARIENSRYKANNPGKKNK